MATVLPVPMSVVAGTALLAAAVRRLPRLAGVGISWATMGMAVVGGPWLPQPGVDPIRPVRVVHANMSQTNPSLDEGLADLRAERGDVVVVIEATTRSERRLRHAYPYRVPIGDQMVVSRYRTGLRRQSTRRTVPLRPAHRARPRPGPALAPLVLTRNR